MASFDSIWNIALGVLSIVMGIQVVWRYLKKRLPSKRLRRMFKLLDDADALLLSCGEEGLVHGEKAEGFRMNLMRLRQAAAEVRLEAHTAKNYPEEFANMLKGLTERIDSIYQEAKGIRANISTSSLRERERLAAERRAEEDAANTPPSPEPAEAVSSTEVEAASETCVDAADALDVQVATPLGEAASPLPEHHRVQFPLPSTISTPPRALIGPGAPPAAYAHQEISSIAAIAPFATTRPSHKKVRHGDHRYVSSNSDSLVSSLHNFQRGDPLSRARTMAKLLHHTCPCTHGGGPVYLIDPQQLAVRELAEDDSDSSGDDLADELAVRTVRVVA